MHLSGHNTQIECFGSFFQLFEGRGFFSKLKVGWDGVVRGILFFIPGGWGPAPDPSPPMSKFCLFPKPPQYLLDSNGFVVLGGAKDGQIGQMGGKGLGQDKLIFAITSSFGGHFLRFRFFGTWFDPTSELDQATPSQLSGHRFRFLGGGAISTFQHQEMAILFTRFGVYFTLVISHPE